MCGEKLKNDDTFRIQRSHVLGLLGVEGAHLNLVVQHGGRVFLEEHLVDGHVECGDYLLRVADQLAVQRRVECLQVGAVHV